MSEIVSQCVNSEFKASFSLVGAGIVGVAKWLWWLLLTKISRLYSEDCRLTEKGQEVVAVREES